MMLSLIHPDAPRLDRRYGLLARYSRAAAEHFALLDLRPLLGR